MSFLIRLLAVISIALAPICAVAREAPRVSRVAFKDGRATIKGSLKGYATNDYVFPAGAGESIKIAIKTNGLSNYFNVNPPGSDEAIFNGSISGDSFDGVAGVAGDYTARVYLMRNDARRGRTAHYTLTMALGEKAATNEKGPDFADGLSGGPDYWEATGVARGDSLKIRAAPSPKAKLVSSVVNGAALKNLGCTNTGGQRWCRVSTTAGATGWANGRFLREGPGPQAR
jgi:hypothetical protein